MHPNVARQEIFRCPKAELGGDTPKLSDGLAVVEALPNLRETIAVHEHYSVHELDARLIAGRDDFLHFRSVHAARFLAHQVLAGFGRLDRPFLAGSGRQWNVDGIDILARKHFLIASDSPRGRIKGNVSLTFVDVSLSSRLVSARHSDEACVPCVLD